MGHRGKKLSRQRSAGSGSFIGAGASGAPQPQFLERAGSVDSLASDRPLLPGAWTGRSLEMSTLGRCCHA